MSLFMHLPPAQAPTRHAVPPARGRPGAQGRTLFNSVHGPIDMDLFSLIDCARLVVFPDPPTDAPAGMAEILSHRSTGPPRAVVVVVVVVVMRALRISSAVAMRWNRAVAMRYALHVAIR